MFRLLEVKKAYGEYNCVLRELDHLEGLRSISDTKEPTPFSKAPLHPFWHKHFFAGQHMLANVGLHWGLRGGGEGNHRLDSAIKEIAESSGEDADVWPGQLAHRFYSGGLETRTARRDLTGDWIIYAKHDGRNYYLDVATHEEAKKMGDAAVYSKIQQGSQAEFPFLF